MKEKKRFLLATVSVLSFVLCDGSVSFAAGSGDKSPEDSCVAGDVCIIEQDASITRANEHYTRIDSFYNGTFKGTSIEVNGAVSSLKHSTLEFDDSNLSGDIRSYGTFKMKGGTLDASKIAHETTFKTIEFYGKTTLNDVAITATGYDESEPQTALKATAREDGYFTMNGGSLISDTTFGFVVEGDWGSPSGADTQQSYQVELRDVNITNSGLSAFESSLADHDTLNIYGGNINFQGDLGFAVKLRGGKIQLDGTKIISNSAGVSLVDPFDSTSLDMRHFSIETKGGNLSDGLYMQGGVTVRLEEGQIKTKNGSGLHLAPVSLTGLAKGALDSIYHVERVAIATSGNMAHGIINAYGDLTLRDVDITVQGENSYGIWAADDVGALSSDGAIFSRTKMSGGSIHVDGMEKGFGAASAAGADMKAVLELDKVHITTTNDVSAVSAGNGSHVSVNDSTMITTGSYSHGINVYDGPSLPSGPDETRVNIDNSELISQDGVGAFFENYDNREKVTLRNSTLKGDSLIFAVDSYGADRSADSGIIFNADSSALFGHAFMQDTARLTMNLTNNSIWTLRPSRNVRDSFGDEFNPGRSDLSFLNINNSQIFFDNSSIAYSFSGEGLYQTLVVGTGDLGGNHAVYNAGERGTSHITLNTWLSGGGTDYHKTDRLLINGDVSGITTVHINPIKDSPGGSTNVSTPMAFDGISIIQASGLADAAAFELAGGYVAYGPFKYVLYGYGPQGTTDLETTTKYGGLAYKDDRLVDVVERDWDHWDWRLQTENLTPPGPGPAPDPTPDPDPKPDPNPDPTPDPDPKPDPNPDPTPDPDPKPDPNPDPDPKPDPRPDPTPDPDPDPKPDPSPDPTPDPDPKPDPNPDPTPDPDPKPDPNPDPTPDPDPKPDPRPDPTPDPDPKPDPRPDPTPDPDPKPDPTPDPDPKPDPTPRPRPDPIVTPNVVPQVPSYILAPTALFQAGRLNFISLQHHLAESRHAADSAPDDGRGSFFMRAYGGDYSYTSNRLLSQYGYDADIRYTGMQLGGTFYGFESENSVTRFGLAGSYGDLAFKPRSVSGSQKTSLDVWNLSPYMTWQHKSGGYVELIVSYGGFDGHVSTDARGRTASLEGHSYAASIEAGMPFALPFGGLTFEPQAQILYQRLNFDESQDIDGFPLAIASPEQWQLRIGGQIQKSLIGVANGSDLKIYGKLDVLHAFQDENHLWVGHHFDTGRFGTHLETGIGINGTLFGKTNLYGDVTWSERISSAGTSGISFNTGFKTHF